MILKIKTLLSVVIAVSSTALVANCSGQGCDSCAQAQFAPAQIAPVQFAPAQIAPVQFAPAQVAVPCNTCGPVAAAPARRGGCAGCRLAGGGGGGRGARIDEFHAKVDHFKAINAKIVARNEAWPKPFECADRQNYFSFWEPQIDQGWEEQCVLTAQHFDSETNELNRFGQNAVAGIMQNNPSNRRTVFIHRDVNAQINQERRSQVENTIRTFYGHTTTAQVAFSNKKPVTTSGSRGAQIQEQWLGAQPTPAIAVSSGGSVAGALSSN